MRRGIRRAGHLVLAGLMLLCFCMAQIQSGSREPGKDYATILKSTGTWDYAAAMEMIRMEGEQKLPQEFALWGEKEGVQILNRDLSRNTDVSVIEAAGNLGMVMKASVPLDVEDKNGCLIAEDTAYDLFGGQNPLGGKIQYGERTLTVRGILEGGTDTLVVRAAETTTDLLDTITLEISRKGGELVDPVHAFLSRHGVEGNTLSLHLLKSWAKLALLCLPIVMGVRMAGKFMALVRGGRGRQKAFLPGIAALAGLTLLFIYAFWIPVNLPKDMIPTRWSDFAFWKQFAQDRQAELMLLLKTDKRGPELLVIQPFLSCLNYMAGALLLYWACFRHFRPVTGCGAILGIMFSWLGVFAVILVFEAEGSILISCRNVWFILAFELTGRYLYGCIVPFYSIILVHKDKLIDTAQA